MTSPIVTRGGWLSGNPTGEEVVMPDGTRVKYFMGSEYSRDPQEDRRSRHGAVVTEINGKPPRLLNFYGNWKVRRFLYGELGFPAEMKGYEDRGRRGPEVFLLHAAGFNF